jgi:hypothetical protein
MKKKKKSENKERDDKYYELRITSGKERPITRLLVVSSGRALPPRSPHDLLDVQRASYHRKYNVLYLYNLDRTGPVPTPIVP